MKKIITFIVLVLIIGFFVKYILDNISEFKSILNVDPSRFWILGIIAIILLIILYVNGLILGMLMEPFKINLNFREKWGLSVITHFYNLITPFRGGAIIRSIYLKKKYEFSFTKFVSTLSAIYIIIFLVGSFMGILSMLLIWLFEGFFHLPIFILLSLIFLFFLFMIIFSPKIPKTNYKILNKLSETLDGWYLIRDNKKTLFLIGLISLLQIILTAFSVKLSYDIFLIDVGILKSLFISSINTISLLIQITPGNLGLADAIMVFSAKIVGIPLAGSVTATIVKRSLELIIIFILGPITSYFMMKSIKKSEFKSFSR